MVTKMEDRVKVELEAWSKVILDQLRLCDSDSLPHNPEMLGRIAVQFNQGALLQYQYGEIERAETLCRGEIELFMHLSSCSSKGPLCLAKVITPYMNLARIHGQKGEVRESLNIFENIYRFGIQQQDLTISGHRIVLDSAPAMFAAEPGLQKVMVSCRVVEAARVLQVIEDYPALLALAETNAPFPEYQNAFFKQYLLEVRSRALLALGQYERAIEALSECCGQMPMNSIDRIVIHTLLSQIYRQWGRLDLAGETLTKLEDLLAQVEKFGRRLPILRQIAYRLALERHALGDDSRALEPAEKAFKWSTELSDQPGSIKCGILLLRICSNPATSSYSPATQRHWYDQLHQLASTTFFRLDRACAYWELGLSSRHAGTDDEEPWKTACEHLLNSYDLYRSIPFVDSRQGAEAVKRSLDPLAHSFPVHVKPSDEIARIKNSSIDSVFDALMKYVPKPFVATSKPSPDSCCASHNFQGMNGPLKPRPHIPQTPFAD